MPPQNHTTTASEELKDKFVQILQKSGITDEVQEVLIKEPPELQGEHMATATVYVQINFKDATLKPKNLFVKKFASNELHTQMVKAMRIMEKESSFFNEFLPTANKFCKEQIGVDNMLDFFPKCLHGDDEMVVQENLVLDSNYVMHCKDERQDEFTAKMVIEHLAKFHAVSHAMVQKGGVDEFKRKWALNIIEAFTSENNPMMDSMFDNGINTCMNIVKMQGDEFADADYTLKALASYIGQVGPQIKKCYKGDDSKLVVLNHGDCWNNNMLFQKDPGTGKATKHIFVDLQITRLGSPNLDLGYFIFTSVKHEVRKNKLKELVEFYYREFNKTAELFGCSCPLTLEEFLVDFKINCTPGFYVTLSFLSAIGALKEINMEDFGTDMDEVVKMFNRVISDWIDRNPDKAKTIAVGIADTVKEYEEIQAKW